jgi:hypothetical protein
MSCCPLVMIDDVSRKKKIIHDPKNLGEIMQVTREEEDLVRKCWTHKWAEAKAIIAENPRLLCTSSDSCGCTPAYYAAFHENSEMLQFMVDVILVSSLPIQSQQLQTGQDWYQTYHVMLQDTFEREDKFGSTPVHACACRGHTNHLVFLLEHSPSGTSILRKMEMDGNTSYTFALNHNYRDTIDFIARYLTPEEILRGIGTCLYVPAPSAPSLPSSSWSCNWPMAASLP